MKPSACSNKRQNLPNKQINGFVCTKDLIKPSRYILFFFFHQLKLFFFWSVLQYLYITVRGNIFRVYINIKELGDVENWALAITKEMNTIENALEYIVADRAGTMSADQISPQKSIRQQPEETETQENQEAEEDDRKETDTKTSTEPQAGESTDTQAAAVWWKKW